MTVRASLCGMFFVECYEPGLRSSEVEAAGERALAVAAELREHGRDVEYIGAIVLPEDEVVFHAFAAESAAAVREASVRAAIEHERVVESIAVGQLELRKQPAEQAAL